MKDLLTKYSLSEIAFFLILVVLAVKELISVLDWFKDRIKKFYDKDYQEQEEHEKLEKEIKDLKYFDKEKVDTTFAEIHTAIEKINSIIYMLMESDKESIKAYITEKHHYFVYEKGWIDDYSLECIEKRFAIYEREHGNSFVEGLMNEIRALPKVPLVEIKSHYQGTADEAKG